METVEAAQTPENVTVTGLPWEALGPQAGNRHNSGLPCMPGVQPADSSGWVTESAHSTPDWPMNQESSFLT